MAESFDEFLKRVGKPEAVKLEMERRAYEDELARDAVRTALQVEEVHFYEQGLTFLAVAFFSAIGVGIVLINAFNGPEAFWSNWLGPTTAVAGAAIALGSLVLWVYANLQQNRITRLIQSERSVDAERPPGA